MAEVGIEGPVHLIDVENEDPDPRAVLSGLLDHRDRLGTRYGTYYIHAQSDLYLYLFQIATDYHFQFDKNWLSKHGILDFQGSWSNSQGPLSEEIIDLITASI